MGDDLLSVTEAAKRLSCSRGHVYNLIKVGHFRTVNIKATGTRSKTRLYPEDLERYVELLTTARRT
jgi:excisionase family DNA binding protein